MWFYADGTRNPDTYYVILQLLAKIIADITSRFGNCHLFHKYIFIKYKSKKIIMLLFSILRAFQMLLLLVTPCKISRFYNNSI